MDLFTCLGWREKVLHKVTRRNSKQLSTSEIGLSALREVMSTPFLAIYYIYLYQNNNIPFTSFLLRPVGWWFPCDPFPFPYMYYSHQLLFASISVSLYYILVEVDHSASPNHPPQSDSLCQCQYANGTPNPYIYIYIYIYFKSPSKKVPIV